MSEIKLPRLLGAAREFNIGQDTLVEFLAKKGFNRDELKPTAKLSEDMYRALQSEFQNDKNTKTKADQVEIPKNTPETATVFKRKKDDIIITKKEVKEPAKVEEQPVEEKEIVKEVVPEIVKEVIKEIVQEVVEVPVVVAKVQEPEKPAITEVEATLAPEPEPIIAPSVPVVTEIHKVEEHLIEGPKIIAKIDLNAIDSSTRPKKASKKAEPVVVTEVTPETVAENAPVTEEVVKPAKPVKAAPVEKVHKPAPVKEEVVAATPVEVKPEPVVPQQPEAEAPSVIENIEVEKLTGPVIVGKIKLPVDNDTRPKTSYKELNDRKRKRIPINKPGSAPAHGGQNQGQGHKPAHPKTPAPPPRPDGPRPVLQKQTPAQQLRNNQQGPGGRGPAARTGPRPTLQRGTVGGGHNRFENKEIDAKEIQEKIKETQAKLAGQSGRGKSLKAKHRRQKRDDAAEAMGDMQEDNKLQVTEFVTVSELANLMDVSFADVIGKCMGLGIMVSINQRLDAEVIELVVGEFGYEVEFIGLDDVEEEEEVVEADDNLVTRPPIVTIMGHVDHGKTSLLDYIRRANVVAGEAGGITQHIGAYEVTLPNGKAITFLDTPGHEAFTAMRARGAKITDIAVIVIAADDAVMPQTKEAISHAQAAGVPMIFAINKIDKDGANSQKIFEQLSMMNILVEEWGGKFQSQEISAKKGLNVELLLEKILLEAEVLDVKANPEREASGSIIEASLDKGRGYVATILVQNGTLNQGDIIVSGQHSGRIKAMFNERNQRIQTAPPSTPVVILGLNGAPQAGEKFKIYEDEGEAKEVASKRAQIMREQGLRARKHITLDEIGRRLALGNFKELNIIIKGDVDGSVEALSDSLQKLSNPEIAVNIVHKAVGQISESDVLLATASDAILIGFNVRPSFQANKLAQNEGVEIKMYSIIYNAIEEVKSAMEGMLEPKIQEKEVATVEIREVYKFDKATVAGCFVTDGKIKRDAKIRLYRDGILLYPRQEGAFAELGSLKRYKDDVKEVANNTECGLTLRNFTDLNVGDTIIAYEEEELKRTL